MLQLPIKACAYVRGTQRYLLGYDSRCRATQQQQTTARADNTILLHFHTGGVTCFFPFFSFSFSFHISCLQRGVQLHPNEAHNNR